MPMVDRLMEAAARTDGWRDHFEPLAQKVVNAQHFVFSLDAKAAISNIASSKPSSLLAALPLCSLPFNGCWFEWPGTPTGGDEFRRPAGQGEEIPKVVGAFLESLAGPKRFLLTMLYERSASNHDHANSHPPLVIGTVSLLVDFESLPDPEFVERARRSNDVDPIYAKRFGVAEGKAAFSLMERAIGVPSPYTEPMMEMLKRQGLAGRARELLQVGQKDITGEINFVIGALALINARNCVEITPVDLQKINRARTQSRKQPLVEYSTVNIVLSRSEKRALRDGMPNANAGIRQHVVRGHFKFRRGNIFWWRPHIRGSLKNGEVRRAGYEVRES